MISNKMAVQGMLFACLQNGVQSGKAQECRSNCSDLWHSISKHGYAVLGCDEEEYKEVKRALKACEAFFALDMATKRAFNGASADQGYSKRSNGEEFLATRLGMPAPAGSQHPAQRPQLEAVGRTRCNFGRDIRMPFGGPIRLARLTSTSPARMT